MSNQFTEATIFEHRFWLQILGDHGRFIYYGLPIDEEELLKKANRYIRIFDQLLAKSRQSLSNAELDALSKDAYSQALEVRTFKLNLLELHLQGKTKIKLSPTFINHMVNEVEEYIENLRYIVKGTLPPTQHPIHHHLIWLQDAAGHAGAINDSLDAIEKDFKAKSNYFTKEFEHFYLKAIEIAGYLRTGLQTFPALNRFNKQVDTEMSIFKDFLREIEELELNAEILGIFSPLMADHMAREECYYLIKLAESSGTPLPKCDPTKPRVSM
jgi:hypothetical protein